MMPLVCIGAINADYIYRVPHLPLPGETLAARDMTRMLGGKGANQSIAAARAGGRVAQVGAVGTDGGWMLDVLTANGISVAGVAQLDGPSGHAIIAVDDAAENNIMLYPGSNHRLNKAQISAALADEAGFALMQNETNLGTFAAKTAHAAGWRVIYSAAPFHVEPLAEIAPFADTVLLNAVEAGQWVSATGRTVAQIGAGRVIVTKGAEGCTLVDETGETHFSAPQVKAVDTTGAGDTFAGVYAQGVCAGMPVPDAIARAKIAAAIQVTRPGTSDAMPTDAEIAAFKG